MYQREEERERERERDEEIMNIKTIVKTTNREA